MPLIVTGITPSSISIADAHNSVYDVPNGTIIVDAPVSVTTGIPHVVTLTVRIAVEVLKLESVAEYEIVYTHGILVLTLPDIVTGIDPSSVSIDVAHNSV